MPYPTPRHRLIFLFKQLGVAALYALLIYLDHRYLESGTIFSSFEAASGYALAVLLVGGRRYAWGVFLGAILIGATTDTPGAAALISSGHTLEALCGAWLLKRGNKFDATLQSLRDYLRLILLGGCTCTGIAASAGTAALLVFGYMPSGNFFHELLHWWTGDVLGVALITPLILIGWQTKNDWHGSRITEAVLLLGLTFLAGQVVFLGWLHDSLGNIARSYVMFLFITWVAVRLGTRGAVVAIAVTGTQSTLSTFFRVGYFADDIAQSGMANYWLYTLILSVVGMALAAYISGQKRMDEALRQSETKFRTLYDSTSESMMLIDEKGFIDCNNAALQMFGCATKEEFCSKHPADLSPSQQPCGTSSLLLANQHIATALEKGSHRFGWTCKRVDNGKIFFAETLLNRMVLDDRAFLQVIARDVTEQKHATEEFERFFNLIPDMACIASTDGYFKKINRAWQTTLGYTEQEILSTPFLDFIHPDDIGATLKEVERQLAGGDSSRFCNRYRCKDGSYKLLEWDMIPPVDGTLLYGSARDVTEQRRAEEELNRFFDLVPDLVCIASTDGRFLRINRAWQTTLGYTEQEILSTPFLDFIHPDDRDATMKEVERQMIGKATMHFGNRYRCKDGRYKWLEWDATPAVDQKLLFASARDVTGRKQVEMTLQESEDRLRSIMDNASAVIFLKDTAGRYLLVNSRHEKLFHIPKAEIQGKIDLEIFPKEVADALVEADRKAIQAGQPIEVEERVPQDDGIHTYISVKFPLRNAYGEIYAVCGIATDITERKAAEQRLHDLSAHIQEVREEEKSRIAREIHDELGGTLTALKMDAYWLSRKLPVDGDMVLLERIQSMSRRIDNAVSFTRRIITDLRPSILDDLGLLPAIEWLAGDFHARTGMECQVNCIENEANLDKQRSIALFRILQEALTNVSRHSGASKVEIEFHHGEKEVILAVRDNGCGIHENQMAAPATHGIKSYGLLGMAERVEQLGGTIIFNSPPDGGFCVEVKLPLHAEEKSA